MKIYPIATYILLSELGTDSKKIKARLDEIRAKERIDMAKELIDYAGESLHRFLRKCYTIP
jgi:hypothetical protein